ncbi:MAG: K(+)-transporting ATPase subunit F [Deltaproteobacteria bacterium]|nr:K(+)-transporting ATPase subunit F [Deltaproteobacteria bacterium]
MDAMQMVGAVTAGLLLVYLLVALLKPEWFQ